MTECEWRSAGLVPFVKASGCGNDFLIIHASCSPGEDEIRSFTRTICDRHTGVGADGVEWLYPETGGEAELRARLINADGSEAEISGNGTRCVAAYWVSEHGGTDVRIRTGAGIKTCTLTGRRDSRFEFEMAMGKPEALGATPLTLSSVRLTGFCVNMGNPHFVVLAPEFPADWRELGAAIQAQPYFPNGTNVEFARVVNVHEVECRFFERGAGETQSSGTGSCASAVAAIHSGAAQSPVRVVAPGGAQVVRWKSDGDVFLQGPAQLICAGDIFI